MELLIYVAIFAVLSVMVVSVLAVLAQSWGQARVNRNLFRGGSDALERMVREIRFARAILVADSTFNTNPGTLSLETFVSPTSDATTTVKFFVDSSRLMIKEGGSVASPLTSSSVVVDSFIVWDITPTQYASTTRLELILTAGDGTKFEKSATFVTSTALRGSYQK